MPDAANSNDSGSNICKLQSKPEEHRPLSRAEIQLALSLLRNPRGQRASDNVDWPKK